MKIRFVLLSAIIVLSCIVQDGNCGVISDVYGKVHNKTVAIKDGVTSWLSYGKDLVLGHKDKPEVQGRNGGEVIASDDGLFHQIYSTLLNGFTSARDKVYGFLISDESKKNDGLIKNIYDRVKNRITMITAYVVGEDEMDTPKPDDLTEIRRALNTMINREKNKREGQVQEGVEALKDKVKDANDKLHVGVDKVKDNIDGMKQWAGDHISDGKNSVSETINKGVNEAKDVFRSTLNDWQQSGVEISEKEREVLNALSNRIRNRINNIEHAIEDPKQLSYAGEEKKFAEIRRK